LGSIALAALYITLRRRSPPEFAAERRLAARVLAVATLVQVLHFAEELVTSLHEHLGGIFALPGMPLSAFLVVNLVWLAIWIASVPGLRAARVPAFFAAWFLAIASIFNGIAHPLLAVVAGDYFPGLYSSPFSGGAGIWLCHQLRRATTSTAAADVTPGT
jgi:hypothetical protein